MHMHDVHIKCPCNMHCTCMCAAHAHALYVYVYACCTCACAAHALHTHCACIARNHALYVRTPYTVCTEGAGTPAAQASRANAEHAAATGDGGHRAARDSVCGEWPPRCSLPAARAVRAQGAAPRAAGTGTGTGSAQAVRMQCACSAHAVRTCSAHHTCSTHAAKYTCRIPLHTPACIPPPAAGGVSPRLERPVRLERCGPSVPGRPPSAARGRRRAALRRPQPTHLRPAQPVQSAALGVVPQLATLVSEMHGLGPGGSTHPGGAPR